MEIHVFEIDQVVAGMRLDLYLTEQLPALSRSHVQTLIAENYITINNKATKPGYKLRPNDEIKITIPQAAPLEIKAEDIPLDVLYEDGDIIVINKSRGMVVHPANGNYSGTLVNALLEHCRDLSGINGVIRPGIVHRIDKDTSGVLVVAKNDNAHVSLAEQIKNHSVNRRYIAIVHNVITENAGTVSAPIGRHPVDRKKMAVVTENSKEAITHFQVLERFKQYTFVGLKLETGRTHQIRVHMSYIGFPVVGDPKYGPRKPHFRIQGQALHAQTLGFEHPGTKQYMEFSAPLPEDMEEILKALRRGNPEP